jgi:hypothetical protein
MPDEFPMFFKQDWPTSYEIKWAKRYPNNKTGEKMAKDIIIVIINWRFT